MTHLKNTTSLSNTFNKLFYDTVISNDKAIRDNLKDIISFCKQVLKAKEEKKLNEFLLLAMPYMIIEEEIKLKNGTSKIKLKLVREGSFKNYLTWIYNIANNEEILLKQFMNSKNKIAGLSGLNTFINDIKNPKNKEAKNTSKKVSTSSSVEANEEASNIEDFGIDEFKTLFQNNEVAFNIELVQALESVIKIQLVEKLKNESKVNKEAIKKAM